MPLPSAADRPRRPARLLPHRRALGALTLAAALAVPAAAAAGAGAAVAPAHDARTDPLRAARARADTLVARMTLDEKLSQLHGTGYIFEQRGWTGYTPPIERLGIPALYLADGPNGVGNGATGVTAFPAAIGNAATWDTGLLRRYGEVLGAEQAGKGNGVALAPTVNILRVPGWGRSFETLSEDPELTAAAGTAIVRGIQSAGVVATAKHYAANNQEIGRDSVNAVVGERVLREIYLPQFERMVRAGGVLAVMCAYNRVNGPYACENGGLLGDVLKGDWDFGGFVVSDWFATRSTTPAANAGLDLEMPGGDNPGLPEYFGERLRAAVAAGEVPQARLDDMVARILTARIRAGHLDRPAPGDHDAVVSTPGHQEFARRLAEQGTVLLRNAPVRGRPVLPLDAARLDRLAVIGAAAQEAPLYTGGGSARVIPSRTTTPLTGITARAGDDVTVEYAPGTTGTGPLPALTGPGLTPEEGTGPGLTARYYPTPDLSGPPALTRVEPTISLPQPPPGLTGVWSAAWTGTVTPDVTGDHRWSLRNLGTARLYLDGRLVATNYAQFAPNVAHAVVRMTAGRPVQVRLEYVANTGFGLPGGVELGYQRPDPERWQRAVDAARAADVTVVVVNDVRTEGADLTSLALPGDQDALVRAVAAVNPRTVVVLHTGGPVLMPWLHDVAAVVEAWYPGQESGGALASVLFGDAEPGGRLPVTFPRDDRQGPLTSPIRFPGAGGEVRYDEGLLVGHRWYDATGQRPLFPFGHGLSYTRFRYDGTVVTPTPGGGARVSVRVTNTGRRAGSDVVQVYVALPRGAGEPRRLAAFTKVALDPGRSRRVSVDLTARAFQVWDAARDRWVSPRGRYVVQVGRSAAEVRTVGVVRR